MDITRAKMTSIHAQIVNMKSENAYGNYERKYGLYKSPNCGSPLTIHWTIQKWVSRLGEIRENKEKHEGNAQQTPAKWGRKKSPLKTPKMWISISHSLNNIKVGFLGHGKMRKCRKHEGKMPRSSNYMIEQNIWVNNVLGIYFQVFTCPISKKLFSQKWLASPIRIWLSYSSPSQGIKLLNQFLNQWA